MRNWLSQLRGRGSELHVDDPRFDDWEVVRDFEDLETAKAWRRHVEQAGIEAVLTSDWPLDRFGGATSRCASRPGDGATPRSSSAGSTYDYRLTCESSEDQ